jgi:4-azaleucine resistance transporter AzlC
LTAEGKFSAKGVVAGARQCVPVALSVFAYGLVFGVLARQAGLSPLEAILMSALVFAGSSQFVALGLWAMPLPVGALILTTLVVNLRHILLGAALRRKFRGVSARKAYPTLFLMADEDWALTLKYFTEGGDDSAFLLGSGIELYFAWLAATFSGYFASAAIPDPKSIGLDFAFTAVFLALLVGLWRGRESLLPWLGAAVVAVAAAHWLPSTWYILLGGLTGAAIAMVHHAD